ncbi:hypothetical protein EDD11_007498 [Mortierella claussenii]|nr:hypothetical protein EDD11_007498 [Mortierella claussenii]
MSITRSPSALTWTAALPSLPEHIVFEASPHDREQLHKSSSANAGTLSPSETSDMKETLRQSLTEPLACSRESNKSDSVISSQHSNSSSIPINRPYQPYRSQSVSSYSPDNSATSRSFKSSYSNNSSITNQSLPPAIVTSSSYSSLPYSPAVAFLSNFVESTAPRPPPDEEGSLVGDYIMGKVIGHGGFSVVREAFLADMSDEDVYNRLRCRVAVKIVRTQTGASDNDRVQKMLNKEITIWCQISHPNVLPFIAVEKLPTDTFIFCELCSGGHLLHYLTQHSNNNTGETVRPTSTAPPDFPSVHSGLEEQEARRIFNQVADALRYLHEEKRIVHRDIKLENVLQHEDGTWKVCDFGLAEYQDEEAAASFDDTLIVSSRQKSTIGLSKLSPTCGSDKSPSSSPSGNSQLGYCKVKEEEQAIVGGSLAYCSPEQFALSQATTMPSIRCLVPGCGTLCASDRPTPLL